MSELQEFTLFSSLPKEIRLLTWECTLQQRLLPLHCTNQSSSKAVANNAYNLLIWRRGPSANIPISDMRRRLAAIVCLTVDSVDTVPALSACHESRDLALSSGYRVWILQNKEGQKRDIMWNPIFDTVAFVKPHTHALPAIYTHILKMQFPSQMREIQRLAVPTTNWKPMPRNDNEWPEKITFATRWLEFESLKEIVIVLDKAWEENFVNRLKHYSPAMHDRERLEIPGDLQSSLKKCKENAYCDWKSPTLRVVRNENRIMDLDRKSEQMTLRCLPCPDLEIYT